MSWAALWYMQGESTSLPVGELTIELSSEEITVEIETPDLEIEVE